MSGGLAPEAAPSYEFSASVHRLPKYLPAGKLHAGVFELGNADGAPGRSLPIPLRGHPGLVDFGGDFRVNDLALLARAIGAGDNMAAAYEEAASYLGLAPGITTQPRPPPRPTPALGPL